MSLEVGPDLLAGLSEAAWGVRERSRILGKTKVGCAALGGTGSIWVGCNVEHRYRSHDIHAETNALGNLVAGGDSVLELVLVAAERDFFTPCGGCMDWIFELGGPTCGVAVQSGRNAEISVYEARELMPFYPR